MGQKSRAPGSAIQVVDGKYRLLSSIGRGGMGEVFVAEHLASRRTVAIKVLSATTFSRKDVKRFVREARVMVRLGSEHVARVFDVGKLNSEQPYIVMEHLRGQDFSRLLQTFGRLGIEDAVASIIQASSALAEAHGMGIVHRDLKPSNLFLSQGPDGRCIVKVLDFGISMAPDEGDWERITASTDVFGTPEYMSPEQARSTRQVDARSDIWSLGLILAECLSGMPVCTGAMQRAMLASDGASPIPNLRLEGTGTPPELEKVIRRCLQRNPRDRYQNVAELVDALRPFAGNELPFAALSIGPNAKASKHLDAATLDAATLDAATITEGAGENLSHVRVHAPNGLRWLLVGALAALAVTLTTAFAGPDASSSKALPKASREVVAAGTKSVQRFGTRAQSVRSPNGGSGALSDRR